MADAAIHDVWWPGHAYEEENLCDNTGKPYLLTSKAHKAYVMKKLGVRECGDRINGARVQPRRTWLETMRLGRKK